jgi:hypothetical protein
MKYRTIEIFEPCERFSSCFDKNLWEATKIFFGCRNGEKVPIPTVNPIYSILLGITCYIIIRPPPTTMPVSLPRGGGRSQSGRGGGRGRDGGRIGGRGRGGRGGPLPSRELNPMLMSNSQNTTLLEATAPPTGSSFLTVRPAGIVSSIILPRMKMHSKRMTRCRGVPRNDGSSDSMEGQ